jgi:hypothetical protein
LIDKTYPNTWYNPTKNELEDIVAPIAFDMDSVMLELDPLFFNGLSQWFGVEITNDVSKEGWDRFDMTGHEVAGAEIAKAIGPVISNITPFCDPTEYMLQALSLVYSMTGLPITVVTARTKENIPVTWDWLTEHLDGIPFNLIVCNGMQKEVVLKRIDNQMFIDDRYKTIKTLEDHIRFPVLYQRPWNQGRPESAGVAEVSNLWGVVSLLQHFFMEDKNA